MRKSKFTRRINKYVKRFKSYSTRKKAAVTAGAVLIFMLVFPVASYAYFVRDISDPERLMNRNNTGLALLDKNDKIFYSYGRVQHEDGVGLAQTSDYLEQGLIASEDKEFYKHQGYSLRGMARALYGNILNKDLTKYGGSTITQQLVKNDLLSASKNPLRKYQELSIAIAVDRHYTKDEILRMYLNSVYYGEGAFGIGPASKAYFNKSPDQLSLAESAMLIGVLPAPSVYSPISGDKELAKKQQNRVLAHMVEAKYITEEQKKQALAEELHYESALMATNSYAHHFAQMVVAQLNDKYGEEKVTRSGFNVKTSLDLDWQKKAEELVRNRVSQLENQGGTNSSLVAIDPRSSEVRALVGSVDWDDQEFGKVNMALSPRQPGSSFKPIYYAEALDKKLITPATILHDTPKTFGTYKPQNYDFRFMGNISARRALAQSRNLTAIEVMEKLGVRESADAARRMGIKTINQPDKYGLSLALGTAEASLLDMTNAYAAFANKGEQSAPVVITSIRNKFDKEIFKNKNEIKRVQSPQASFLISSMLADPQARAPVFSSLTIPGRAVAVKTGTTDDYKDAWTIGYTPSVVLGVWVGNNNNKPMSGIAGSSGAGPIWRGMMAYMLQGTKAEDFQQPSRIVRLLICNSSGYRAFNEGADTRYEYFIKGTAPTQSCNVKPVVKEEEEKQEDKKEEKKEEQPPVVLKKCNDTIDNDGDGKIDAADPGCSSTEDDDETDEGPPVQD